MSIDNELIKIFAGRFINRQDAYNMQWQNGKGYSAIYEPVTDELIAQHLEGSITLSIPALSLNNAGKWLCFDGDTNNGALDQLERFLVTYDWHCVRDSKRAEKDGHLWLFFDKPIPGTCLVNLNKAIVKLSSISTTELDIFPAQEQIEKLGSSVRLPINYHRKIKQRTWFDIPEKNLESQLTWLAAQPLNDADSAIELAEEHKRVALPPIKRNFTTAYKGTIDFKETAQAALQQAQSIVSHWLPGGKGNLHYTALNPRRADNHAGSFSVNLRKGCWKDFATNDGGGDLISLVAYLDDCSQLDAAKSWPGLSDSVAARRRLKRRVDMRMSRWQGRYE